jgi:hypothetical protein
MCNSFSPCSRSGCMALSLVVSHLLRVRPGDDWKLIGQATGNSGSGSRRQGLVGQRKPSDLMTPIVRIGIKSPVAPELSHMAACGTSVLSRVHVFQRADGAAEKLVMQCRALDPQ